MQGLFITRQFERVYRKSDSKLKQRMSKWVNALCGKGVTRYSFPNAKFVMVDAEEGMTVVIVLKDRFALVINGIGNTVTLDQQCFMMSSRMRTIFKNLNVNPKGLYRSVKLEKELDKALASNEFKHIPRSTMVKYCHYNDEEQQV